MRKYRRTKLGHRICNHCDLELPATAEFFARDRTRALGLGYQCLTCMRDQSHKRGDPRRARYANLTDAQKRQRRDRSREIAHTPLGRAKMLRFGYIKRDACDFTPQELMLYLEQPCYYCGTVALPRGLDRIDNARAHTKDNVVPCCRPCNTARGVRLSSEHMKEVVSRIVEREMHRRLTRP